MSSAKLEEQILILTEFSPTDRAPDTPHLTFSLDARPWFLIDEDCYEISFTITRDENDTDRRPCVIQWDPIKDGFGQSGITLLCREADSWRHVQINPRRLSTNPLHPDVPTNAESCLKQLDPGTSVSWKTKLPSVFLDALSPGKFYEILWCGGKISLWDWGTLAERTARDQLIPKSPEIILPGGAYQEVEVVEVFEESDDEDCVYNLPSSPSSISPSSRNSDAPSFTVTITGPETLSIKDSVSDSKLRCPVTVNVSYDRPQHSMGDKRPITFLTTIFKIIDNRVDGFRLYAKDGDEWKGHEVNYLIYRHAYRFTKPAPFKVGYDDGYHFQTLMPGESWSFTRHVTDFPKEFAPGDKFRYQFKGSTLNWWDWGNYEDHKETVVWIEEDLLDSPKDNGGRPVIVLPASNYIEFTLIE
ncbi:hypothetical protein N7489_004892 [Penicillium chrysogenum]|uniref:uncharacterized protein n=1 Tax=Penicillium chrysogenum TaxID=5076 RepID=UPI0024DF2B28|nr:uncharacterized protein N7489_004892 [Penicillium chrysogenum]KAJ5244796.1 hypothetical protein N7489_004892 [Penicillium chrysogenum]KAJ5849336.1 hypothetical protein N7534_008025 [Penicillium rubens]